MKFIDVLNNIEVLNDEAKKAITEAFETAVSTRVAERVQLEVKDALTTLDNEHADQLKTLLEAIDTDHSDKFVKAVSRIDEDHSRKLQKLVKHFNDVISKDAYALRDQLSENMSNYLDLYLDKVIPVEDVKAAVANTHATRILDAVKQLVSVDEKYINSNIREALQDGKDRMDTLHGRLNETLKENVELKRSVNNIQASLLLERKTQDMPKAKKQYILKLLEAKSPAYINDNFEYVVEMFEKADDVQQVIIEKKSAPRKTEASAPANRHGVDTPRVITEKVEPRPTHVNGYLSELQAQETRLK